MCVCTLHVCVCVCPACVCAPSRATDGYYSVRVTNPAGATNATVFEAGVSSFLGSRLVANTTYAAAVDAMGAVAGLHVDVVTCFGNRSGFRGSDSARDSGWVRAN